MTAAIALAGVMGLVIGSFLNVVDLPPAARRVADGPRRAARAARPRSRPTTTSPSVSWLLLRGRCRHCGMRISPRYPLVELATAAAVRRGGRWRRTPASDVWIGLAFVTLLVPVTLIDLDLQIIPNKLLLPGAVVGLALVAALQPDDLRRAPDRRRPPPAASCCSRSLAHPRGMGMGDVKLAARDGHLPRPRGRPGDARGARRRAPWSGSASSPARASRRGARPRVPFGPFLALGGLVGLLAGGEIVDWYLDNFA